MWDFLMGYLVGDATGLARIVRPLLWVLLIGSLAAGLIYTSVVLKAVSERSRASHVPAHRLR